MRAEELSTIKLNNNETEFELEDKILTLSSPYLKKKRNRSNLVLCVYCLHSLETKLLDCHLLVCIERNKVSNSTSSSQSQKRSSKVKLLSMSHKDLVELVHAEFKKRVSSLLPVVVQDFKSLDTEPFSTAE